MSKIAMVFAGVATVLMAGASAYAGVEGLDFTVVVSSEGSSDVEGVLGFDTQSTFSFAADSGPEGIGTYVVTSGGAALTVVEAVATSSDFDVEFTAVAFDPKQLPGILGAIARRQEVPAQVRGFGTNNLLESNFSFTGEEILLVE